MTDIQNNDPRRLLNRVLLGVVIVMGVLIVAAFLALVYGAITGFGKHAVAGRAPDSAAAQSAVTLQSLPRGARILDMKVADGRTVVRLETANGDEIDIFDTASGRLISRIAPQAK